MDLSTLTTSRKCITEEATLVAGDDDQLKIQGYRVNRTKQTICLLLVLCTAGVLRLIFFWKPNWMLYCTHNKCSLKDADKVLLIDKYEQIFVEKIEICRTKSSNDLLRPIANGKFASVTSLRRMENRKTRFLWNEEKNRFERLLGLDFGYIQCSEICAQQGLAEEEQSKRLRLFGSNLIEIKIEPIVKILFTEVLNPFYIYQFVAIGFWMADEYFYYASYILFMSLVSLALTTYQIRVNQKRLREKVSDSSEVLVLRAGGNRTERIDSSQLVPGDVLILDDPITEKTPQNTINNNSMLQCDAVLLSGEVIVNESMLTGESAPVTKTPLRDCAKIFDPKEDGKHVLYCGTCVMQVRKLGHDRPRALVLRTNFETARGELVKSILFPKPIDFKFSRHINHFLAAMALLALIGFTYTVTLKIMRQEGIAEILFKAIDLVMIVVPPELPAAMTIATIFVDRRIRNRKIFCLSPRAITISGCIDCVCFDKTGTLTEDSIDLHEIVRVEQTDMSTMTTSPARFTVPINNVDRLDANDSLLRCLATCHSLKLLADNFIGDDLEIKLFNWTGWRLTEPVESEKMYGYTVTTLVSPQFDIIGLNDIGVLKQFPFTSKASRMSVIVCSIDKDSCRVSDDFEFFIKGAPETIVQMCRPETVPQNFTEKLNEYTNKSYRVLAVATKSFPRFSAAQLKSNSMEFYECELVFLGFIVVRNMLKSSTTKTINTLNRANIRSIMVTGDNLMTALSVARECGLTSTQDDIAVVEAKPSAIGKPALRWNFHQDDNINNSKTLSHSVKIEPNERYKLAITGATFKIMRKYYPELIPSFMVRVAVYARMAPEQKQQLVEMLQSVGYYVAMCGDGANDASALKIAHTGISLSDTEASVASAFTSLTGQISCVVDLIREGRAALVSVFGIVRYMMCYNITTFLAICILYYYYSALTDIQNLYQDIVLISLYVFLFGRTYPHHTLSPLKPPDSLISIGQFSSILLQLGLVAIFQFACIIYLHTQPWYTPHRLTGDVEPESNASYVCHDNYALFMMQLFQYVTLVIIFSKGAPYRRPLYRNKILTAAIVITTCLTAFIVITPERPFSWIATFFDLAFKDFPMHFRLQIVGLNVIHFIIAILVEKFVVEMWIARISKKYQQQPFDKIYEETRQMHWLNR